MEKRDHVKRAVDLALALPGFVVAAPIMLAAMIAIRIGSPGPAIFAQMRVGRGERPFRCYKLRTMVVGTPSLPTHEVCVSSTTGIGRVLRKFKLDELPQLWNVLRGEMSLVGPRPCLPTQTTLIEQRRALGVFSMAPGITGLAQVRDIDMSQPVLLAQTDAEYMRTRSLAGDIGLVLRTALGPLARGLFEPRRPGTSSAPGGRPGIIRAPARGDRLAE